MTVRTRQQNKSVNRRWLAFAVFSHLIPLLTVLGFSRLLVLVRQPGYLKRYVKNINSTNT